MTLHFGFNLVPGIDGFEQSTSSPLRVHEISNVSDVIGRHFSEIINKLLFKHAHQEIISQIL